nr:alpha/beta hydrolase-fold protein [Mangrovicoccus ximenensis]
MAPSVLRSLLGAAALLAATASGPRAEVRFGNVAASETLDRPVRYAVYLPPGYGSDGRDYPVLYLLHGGGSGQPSDWFTLAGIDQLLDRMIGSGEIRPLIAVAPDGRRDAGNAVATYFLDDADGATRWETMFFEDFIPAVETRHRAIGSGDARALLGISMGGVAAAVYQLRAPDRFAGAAALAKRARAASPRSWTASGPDCSSRSASAPPMTPSPT